MKAMVLNQLGDLGRTRTPQVMDLPVPEPKPGEILVPFTPEVQEFWLEEANQALLELKERKIPGAKVLRMEGA